MGWIDDKLNELRENAKREFDSGVTNLSQIVRAQANQQSQPEPAASTVQIIQAAPASAKLLTIAALGIGAFFLFKALRNGKRGK